MVRDLATVYLGFNTQLVPFDDELVRQAFAAAINRDEIARVLYQDRVEPAVGVIPPALHGTSASAEATGDVTRARQLLAQSSYGGADALPRITLHTSATISARRCKRC